MSPVTGVLFGRALLRGGVSNSFKPVPGATFAFPFAFAFGFALSLAFAFAFPLAVALLLPRLLISAWRLRPGGRRRAHVVFLSKGPHRNQPGHHRRLGGTNHAASSSNRGCETYLSA